MYTIPVAAVIENVHSENLQLSSEDVNLHLSTTHSIGIVGILIVRLLFNTVWWVASEKVT